MKIKTKDLTGAALDWAVATAIGDELAAKNIQFPRCAKHFPKFSPSTDWSQGGPISDREHLTVGPRPGIRPIGRSWCAQYAHRGATPGADCYSVGDTALVAAMRCFVTSELGEEVEIPEGLL